MDPKDLAKLLRAVASGKTNIEDAVERLRSLPFEDLGYARIDHHRALRRGFPEIVFGQGKTAAQCEGIVETIVKAGQPVIVTRASREQFDRIARHPTRSGRPGQDHHPRVGKGGAKGGKGGATPSPSRSTSPIQHRQGRTDSRLTAALDIPVLKSCRAA